MKSIVKLWHDIVHDNPDDDGSMSARDYLKRNRQVATRVLLNLSEGENPNDEDTYFSLVLKQLRELIVAIDEADYILGEIEGGNPPAPCEVFTAGCNFGGFKASLMHLLWSLEDHYEREGTLIRVAMARHIKELEASDTRRKLAQEAQEAMTWAREQFPSAALDDYRTLLKEKAAEHLDLSVGQLNRRLKMDESPAKMDE
jgi:hypothetical protein